jgi:hypothetical protein
MLTAKFSKMGKGGTLAIYEVRGTSAELTDYISNNFKDSPKGPAFKSNKDGEPILDANGNKTPLLFTAYPMPGKNLWHPLYQVQSGERAGSYTLDKQDIQFESLVAKSMGADLGQAMAQQMAQKYTSSAPMTQSLSALSDDDDDTEESEDSSDDTTSASAEADMTQLGKTAKAGK